MASKKCIFIGGAYGVGKSSMCARYCAGLDIGHYTASDLIKKLRNADEQLYKEVVDAQKNQDSLLRAMEQFILHEHFLLDGHFVIKTAGGPPSRIPLKTYESIGPIGIIIVTGDPEEASIRLKSRDGKYWLSSELEKIQTSELEHGKTVADALGTELHIIPSTDYELFKKTVDLLLMEPIIANHSVDK